MSNTEADLGRRFGTVRQMVESGENEEEKGSGSESSSSSNGSNELPQPNLPPVTVTMSITQSQETANLPPHYKSAAAEASTKIVVPAMFQFGGSRGDEMNARSQNQLMLFPSPQHQLSIGSASASASASATGNTASTYRPPASNLPLDFRLDSSNVGVFGTNPQFHYPLSPMWTTSGNIGYPSARTGLRPLDVMQEPSPTFGSGLQEYRHQNWLGQGMETGSSSFHPYQPQNMALQKMNMIWQDSNPPLPPPPPPPNFDPFNNNLISQGQGDTYFSNFPNSIRYSRNFVYDPMYEALGLPVDPHLRMFNARRDDNGDHE